MLDIRLHTAIDEISAACWNRLCGSDYPFLRHEFLSALERSGSVTPDTGWQPLHLTLHENGHCVGALPLYLKSHSWGEYVFDWAWADAWQRHGLEYYPKLVTAIPFTPATGPRFGLDPCLDQPRALAAISDALRQLCERFNASGWHGLFVPPSVASELEQQGLMKRLGCQYHWFNRGYSSFDDYLASFASRKRKNLRKEREKVARQGIVLRRIEGHDISDTQLRQFYRFYQDTYLKHGMKGYLTPAFFRLLRDTLPSQLLLVLAEQDNETVAGALYLRSRDTLYGRYWGCQDDYDSLHFEACYYQGIEYCIEQGLTRFDPGAQGEHKVRRGFEPTETWSCHWIQEAAFRPAIADFLEREHAPGASADGNARSELPFRNPEPH